MPLVDANGIPIRIGDDRHPTDRTFKGLKDKFYIASTKFGKRGIKIVDLKGYRRPVTRRFPLLFRHVADGESRGSKVVLYPLCLRIPKGPGRFKFQDTFVEFSSPFHVRHGISGKC